jgi:DNA-binding winged helix-turn-helix (wHTH) protein/tetratricopeptide (TPR) repeat protein
MSQTTFRFERCEVRLATREIALDGDLQPVEPRPFDLLVYLIRHRERVVTKDELLDELWPGQCPSPGVIARAVMKARQCIGDNGKVARLIRTVHGTGYRFTGELLQAPPPRPPAAAAPPAASLPLRARVPLALLPFENHTGQADLDWVELGLMSMVAGALGGDPRLQLPELSSLLMALQTLAPQAPPEQRMEVATRLLGARQVVHATVSKELDQYVLAYSVSTQAGQQRLVGPELTELGQRLASALTALVQDADPAPASVGYESADPLVNEALARALQASGEQQWRMAANLFKVVLDIEPLNTGAQLEYLRALAFLGDEAAFAVGERLLQQARAGGHRRLDIAVHEALARAHNNRLSPQGLQHAKVHLAEAIRLAGELGLAQEKKSALRTLMGIVIHERDFPQARRCLDEMERLHDPHGDVVDHTRFLGSCAVAATTMGDPQHGLQLFRTVIGLTEQHGLRDLQAMTLLNSIYPCVDLGLLDEAIRSGESALAMAQSMRNWRLAAGAAERLCLLYRERRALPQMRRVVEEAGRLEMSAPVLKASVLVARGHHAACEGEHHQAVRMLDEALAIYRESGAMLYVRDTLPWLVVSLALSGRADAAQAACGQARNLPGNADDATLQAALRYGEALTVHMQGRHAEARRCLRHAAQAAPVGLWRTHACLDGAWLATEAGEFEVAGELLAGLGPWLDGHPVGAAVQARLRYATGDYPSAHAEQQRYAASIGTSMPGYLATLAARYAAAAARAPARPARLEPVPVLPTAL